MIAIESRSEEFGVDENGEVIEPPLALSIGLDPDETTLPTELMDFVEEDDMLFCEDIPIDD